MALYAGIRSTWSGRFKGTLLIKKEDRLRRLPTRMTANKQAIIHFHLRQSLQVLHLRYTYPTELDMSRTCRCIATPGTPPYLISRAVSAWMPKVPILKTRQHEAFPTTGQIISWVLSLLILAVDHKAGFRGYTARVGYSTPQSWHLWLTQFLLGNSRKPPNDAANLIRTNEE